MFFFGLYIFHFSRLFAMIIAVEGKKMLLVKINNFSCFSIFGSSRWNDGKFLDVGIRQFCLVLLLSLSSSYIDFISHSLRLSDILQISPLRNNAHIHSTLGNNTELPRYTFLCWMMWDISLLHPRPNICINSQISIFISSTIFHRAHHIWDDSIRLVKNFSRNSNWVND